MCLYFNLACNLNNFVSREMNLKGAHFFDFFYMVDNLIMEKILQRIFNFRSAIRLRLRGERGG